MRPPGLTAGAGPVPLSLMDTATQPGEAELKRRLLGTWAGARSRGRPRSEDAACAVGTRLSVPAGYGYLARWSNSLWTLKCLLLLFIPQQFQWPKDQSKPQTGCASCLRLASVAATPALKQTAERSPRLPCGSVNRSVSPVPGPQAVGALCLLRLMRLKNNSSSSTNLYMKHMFI